MSFYSGSLTPEEHEAKREAERMALADYEKAKGTIITVTIITGYDDSGSMDFDGGKFKVKVLETQPENLRHWCDEHLDPYWDVEPIGDYEQLHGFRSFWTYGPSYRVVNGVVQPAENDQVLTLTPLQVVNLAEHSGVKR